jgi:hypothetical protein
MHEIPQHWGWANTVNCSNLMLVGRWWRTGLSLNRYYLGAVS